MPLAPPTLQAPACHAHLIAPGVLSGLEGIPYHEEGPLTRWLMSGADVHPGAHTHVRAGTGFFVAIVLGVREYDTAFGEG